MVADISSALSAYRAAAARTVEPSADDSEKQINPHGTFAELVKSTVEETAALSQKADMLSIQAVKGAADIQDVVLAVSNAEIALQTVVAVRDKVVSAYQEIMQMPI